MKRSVLFFSFMLLFVLLLAFSSSNTTMAEVDEIQLEEFLSNISWTKDELEKYLKFYDLSLEKIETLEQLKSYLGTPVNNENLNDLLGKYEMDYEDLEILLAGYGETLDDYKFIEDLELDVQFYLNNHDEFTVVNDFLSLFGLTEDEMEQLFDHISQLDTDVINTNLSEVSASLVRLNYLRGEEEITIAEQQQLLEIWDTFLTALNINATFMLVNEEDQTEISLKDLLKMASYDGYSLEMSLANLNGNVLATLNYSTDMLNSHLVYESIEQVTEVAALAEEYREKLKVAKLPQTAGHYVTNILLSLFLIIIGGAMYLVCRRGSLEY